MFNLEKVFKVLNEMIQEGIIEDYLIAGSIGAMYYLPPNLFLTKDLDVRIPVNTEENQLITFSEIWHYLTVERGYPIDGQHIIIEGVPVEFFPIEKGLEQEAYNNSELVSFYNTWVKISKPEYIIANYVQTNRKQDREKIRLLLQHYTIDMVLLEQILVRFDLDTKFRHNLDRGFYGY